jgi:hypothetical protein
LERRKDCRPDYEKKVDRKLFDYVDAHRQIKLAMDEVAAINLAGRKMTATYEPMVGGRGGPVNIPEETIAIRITEVEETIRVKRSYIATIEEIVNAALPEEDYRQFVRLYWWTGSKHMPVRIRMATVLAEMPYLEYMDTRRCRRKRDRFYEWRSRIYKRLAEAMGYLEGGKD